MSSNHPAKSGTASAHEILNRIAAAMARGNHQLAAEHANSLLSLGYRHPAVYKARGLAFQAQKQFREALTEFNKARELDPNDPNLINAIGLCFVNLDRPAEAIAAFDQTISFKPAIAHAHSNKAWVLEMLGDRDKASEAYKQAIAIDPDCVEALAGLAAIHSGEGRLDEAQDLARRALAIDANQPTAMTALGAIDLAKRDYPSAEARFRSALDGVGPAPRTRAAVCGLLADALDGQERVDEAFAFYKLKNDELHKIYAPSVAAGKRPQQVAERILSFVAGSPIHTWQAPGTIDAGKGPALHHIFLVGFFRSGTTLLEQVLATHPDVVALEEKDLLAGAAQSFLSNDEGLRRLAELDERELANCRDAYWRGVQEYGLEIENKIFVDKLPLNTLKLPLIAKLFPRSRILFALRDPRDVVLSCFRRHFEINASAFEFLNLENCAAFYSVVMGLARECREKLPLDVHVHRYEEMVEDFDRTVADICRFIGAQWTDRLRDFHRTKVLQVLTPSGPQIRRPLNSDSIGRWRAYRAYLAPVLPRLGHWVEEFDYPRD